MVKVRYKRCIDGEYFSPCTFKNLNCGKFLSRGETPGPLALSNNPLDRESFNINDSKWRVYNDGFQDSANLYLSRSGVICSVATADSSPPDGWVGPLSLSLDLVDQGGAKVLQKHEPQKNLRELTRVKTPMTLKNVFEDPKVSASFAVPPEKPSPAPPSFSSTSRSQSQSSGVSALSKQIVLGKASPKRMSKMVRPQEPAPEPSPPSQSRVKVDLRDLTSARMSLKKPISPITTTSSQTDEERSPREFIKLTPVRVPKEEPALALNDRPLPQPDAPASSSPQLSPSSDPSLRQASAPSPAKVSPGGPPPVVQRKSNVSILLSRPLPQTPSVSTPLERPRAHSKPPELIQPIRSKSPAGSSPLTEGSPSMELRKNPSVASGPPPLKSRRAESPPKGRKIVLPDRRPTIADVVAKEDPSTLYTDMVKIGEGASGSVYLAVHSPSGKKVAIKQMEIMMQPKPDIVVNEVILMSKCSHLSIVRFVDSYLVEGTLWVVMEFVDGEDLTQVISTEEYLTEDVIATCLKSVCAALSHLHEQGIVHRDIKSDNVMVSIVDGQCRLTDFGFGCQLDPTEGADKRTSVVGTSFWMAPEVIQRTPYDTKADVWSLGALAYEMVEKDPPYFGNPHLKTLYQIVKLGLPPIKREISDELRDFIDLCTKRAPEERPTCSELNQHPFLQRVAPSHVLQGLVGNARVAKEEAMVSDDEEKDFEDDY